MFLVGQTRSKKNAAGGLCPRNGCIELSRPPTLEATNFNFFSLNHAILCLLARYCRMTDDDDDGGDDDDDGCECRVRL